MLRESVGRMVALGSLAPLLWSVLGACGAGGSGDGGAEPVQNTGGPGVLGGGGPSQTPDFSGSNGPDFGGEAESVGCSQLEISFEAQTPTALIIVDRSSSQWDNGDNNTWEPMKAGILNVVKDVQEDIRVGMVTYTGQNGGTCPDLYPPMNQVTFDKNNYPVIERDLNSILQPAYKGETPTAATIQQALPALLADSAPGEKVMLLVTDGDPDFCNDPDRTCAMDAVIGAVQAAYAQGVSTTVFGLRGASGAQVSEQHLRDVANAGSGQPVAYPQGVNNATDLANRCRTNPAGSLAGTYSAQSGNAQFFQANGTDTVALGQALDAVIYGIRSCVFDLAGAAEIDPTRADAARISLNGEPPLLFGDPNGWQLRTATQVELLGSACQLLKNPTTKDIKFDFPCDLLIPR